MSGMYTCRWCRMSTDAPNLVSCPTCGAPVDVRDRVSALSALYGNGPLPIDFRAIGDRAAQVKLTRCDIRRVAAARRSASTGQTHSIGGFIGSAEYEGELTEFLPYLEAARWTGVGRQTVWGKGEIRCTATP